jgi:mono/diheme cytochrome c family protein
MPCRHPSYSVRLAVAGVLWLATAIPATAAPPTAKVDYNFQVRPLLADRCFVCHGPDEKKRKAKLRLDDPAVARRVLVPGKPEESEFIRRITATAADEHMPPAKSNLTLSREEIDLLRRWVAEGAEYKLHWAFLPPAEVVPVPLVDSKWPAGPLDRFVFARLEREGVKPSPPASKEDWIRRATFDLTGLPPTCAEVDAFLADDSTAAFARVADRLLASPRFGERLAIDWLDAARYADSFGYQADGDTHVWPWRDWVISAFNDNLPFDQFVTWQLAGDLLPGATRQQRLATAFCRLHRMTNEGGSIPEEWRNEYVSDRVHTFGTTFLGLTMECTRCHDHKYDPLTMKDYYGLGAFFNNIDEWGTYDNSAFRPTPTLPLPAPAQERALAIHAHDVEVRATKLREVEKSRDGAFRAWLGRADLKPDLPGLLGYYPLDKLEANNQLANLTDAKKPGSTSPANTLAAGKVGQALRFTGDDPATFAAPASLDRAQPFAASFWLKTPDAIKQGIVFHREAGTDTGFHGTELSFDEGRLLFALVRFWPGDAIAVRTRAPLPAREWSHVTVSYDGSGRAAGLRIFLNGKPAESEVVRDKLTKNIEAGGGTLTFGERFRSTGLKGGLLDEVRTFGRALTEIEAAQLHDGRSLADALVRKDEAALRPYYLATVDEEMAKARAELRQARERLFADQTGVFEIMTMEEMPHPRQAYILARGNYDAPKDRPVGRDTPTSLPAFPKEAPRDRLGLARWLTDPRHPLTARVAVNRYWQLFFGRGIVATTENFGTQGALPTHPELLDWLARDFIDSGWDVKRLCREIVLSSTYRQRSAATPELRERDPDNLLLAHGPSRRLSAEELRDAALVAGGLLSQKIGGPSVKPYQPAGMWRGMNAFLPDYVADTGEGLHRRSMYTFWRRTSPPPNMLAFDAPGREVCVVRRQTTSTPMQPLILLNDPQFVEAARALGERLLREGGATPEERLSYAFRRAATRKPTERELRLLAELYQGQLKLFRADPVGTQKFLKTGERPPAAGLDPAELAAASATTSAILNLDASVTTR